MGFVLVVVCRMLHPLQHGTQENESLSNRVVYQRGEPQHKADRMPVTSRCRAATRLIPGEFWTQAIADGLKVLCAVPGDRIPDRGLARQRRPLLAMVLSRGRSADPEKLFRDLYGRDPDVRLLLGYRGFTRSH